MARGLAMLSVIVLIGVGFLTARLISPKVGSVQDVCIDTLISLPILTVTNLPNKDIQIDVIDKAQDRIGHITMSSSTPQKIKDLVQVGKSVKQCTLIQ